MPPDAFALGVDLQETSLENMRHVDATRVRVVRRDVFELDELEIRAMRRDAGRPGDVFRHRAQRPRPANHGIESHRRRAFVRAGGVRRAPGARGEGD